MSKKNGGKNRPFVLAGSLEIVGPQMIERLRSGEEIMVEVAQATEFYISVREGQQDAVYPKSPWIDMHEADIKISVDDPDEVDEMLPIKFEDGTGQEFLLQMNAAQVRALSEILQAHARALDAMRVLETEYNVSAPAQA